MAKKKKPATSELAPVTSVVTVPAELIADVRTLIEQTRDAVARSVNSALVLLYWNVGTRIRREILKDQRAEYGEQIVATLSTQLSREYGNGYGKSNLFRIIQFAELFTDSQIVAALSRQLSWSHFIELLPIKEDLKREFYAEMCRVERWSVRALREKINGMLYERTALSKKPEEMVKQELATLRTSDQLTPDLVFRDPYLLNFLGLKDTYSEKDLESAILREIESFLLELGCGFAFVARQKTMVIDGSDFALDLLFYHRRLRRLIAIDLKLGRFEAGFKGQMELYLRWLDQHERQPGEESPLGLILCESAGQEQVELLQLDASGIRVATYLTELPPKDMLEKKLRAVAEHARQRLPGQS
jgi:predicted nuclease of restriction endonuclease-like (RecB) superfamily